MSEDSQPDVLYLLSDQHSPYVLGCYGDPVVETPHLDDLARSGAVLENAYCASPICVPSRMSMLTARHPYQNEVWTNEHILDSGIPTWAHALGAAGYETALVGRLHSIGPDQLRGFSRRLVGDHSPNHAGLPVDRGVLDGTSAPDRISLERSGSGQSAYQVHDEDTAARAVDVLREIADARRSGQPRRPFCLSVGLLLPHQPFVARREDYARYLGRVGPPRHPDSPANTRHEYLRWWRQHTGIDDVTMDEAMRARTAYWALVDRLDELVGQILRGLHESGLADNTLIVYSADHGEQAGEHGMWWKQTFYESSVRVPTIISWPGVIQAGQRCKNVVSSLDVTATVLDAAGAPALPDSTGRSLLELLKHLDQDVRWDDLAFSEYCTDQGWITRMVRQDKWKLNYYHGHPVELFNLEDDPDELVDLAADPVHEQIRHDLLATVLEDWNPDQVVAAMERKRRQGAVLTDWARQTQPRDEYRWNLRPDMNYLDE